MPTPIILTIDGCDYSAELNDSGTAQAVAEALPLNATAHRWGDEYYFSTSLSADGSDPLDDVFKIGELGFWPPGSAFCIFFGPTPVSRNGEPRMANPGHSIGKITGDFESLKSFGNSVRIEVKLGLS
jgi:hypothetical protein